MSTAVGPGRQHPVLHAHVRHAVGDVVDRPVPAPDRAVVQPQLVELRHPARGQLGHRVGVLGDRHQRREVAAVLREQVEDRGDPPLPEPDPGPHALVAQLRRAHVAGLLEQRDPGLGPQPRAEQERRVRTHRQLHAGEALRGVPVAGERLAGGPAGAAASTCRPPPARWSRSRPPGARAPPRAGPIGSSPVMSSRIGSPRSVEHLLVEHRVPARRRTARRPRGGCCSKRRQDPDHGQLRPEVPGLRPGDRQLVEQLVLQVPPLVAGQRPRWQVQLQVPAAELGLELGVRRWPPGRRPRRARAPGRAADEVELDLDAGHRLVPGERVARAASRPGRRGTAAPSPGTAADPVD